MYELEQASFNSSTISLMLLRVGLSTIKVSSTYWKEKIILCFILIMFQYKGTADGDTAVKVLCYKSEGGWFDSRWCHWNFSLT
jgi:hypothetical protein